MNTNKKFALWLLLAALIGVCVAIMTPSKPVANTPIRSGRAQVTATQPAVVQPRSYADLLKVVNDAPATIARLTFASDGLAVMVDFASGAKSTIAIPDSAASTSLSDLARQKGITVEQVPPQAVDPLTLWLPYLFVGGVAVFAIWLFLKHKRDREAQMARVFPNSSPNSPPSQAIVTRPGGKKGEEVEIQKVTFADVAGCDEAVKEMKRVVKGIVARSLYDEFGAELPRGILLFGPPGTGKTLLAKAVAGESDGSIEIASGSDFVEMYVGVGAQRVRDMFKRGREQVKATGKPHIIFIDEIDAVGGKRGSGNSNGGHQEREQTLNALLVEMDGVKSNAGIIIIAATNRVDMLDDALLRPGRFDAQIQVDLPDKAGREKIFAIHTRSKPLAKSVTMTVLANRSFGYSGAEIKGASNRAAINAAERYAEKRAALKEKGLSDDEINKLVVREITVEDFDEGIDFVRHGTAKASRQDSMSSDEKKNTAYHEAGHACAAAVLKGSDPIVKITIMSRSRALGYVQYMPNQDRYSFNVKQAVARIITAMAGRAAQEVYLNTIDTGASNDFEQATQMARRMVTQWGMSRLGRIYVGQQQGEVGPILANNIDCEVRRIVDECYYVARHIVASDRARMEKTVGILLEKETILGAEWDELTVAIPTAVENTDVDFDPAAKDGEKGCRGDHSAHRNTCGESCE